MPLYYSDPSREPRECPACERCDECSGERWPHDRHDAHCSLADGPQHARACSECNGTGRLGDPEARPDIDIRRSLYRGEERFWFKVEPRIRSGALMDSGPYPTESAALTAARAALEGTR